MAKPPLKNNGSIYRGDYVPTGENAAPIPRENLDWRAEPLPYLAPGLITYNLDGHRPKDHPMNISIGCADDYIENRNNWTNFVASTVYFCLSRRCFTRDRY